MRFSPRYAALTVFLFAVEVVIALYVHDSFVRPYVGDALVVILLYCFVMAFFRLPRGRVLLGVLLFACALECAQAVNLVALLGLEDHTILRVVIGTVFSPLDLVAYAAGILVAAGAEHVLTLYRAA